MRPVLLASILLALAGPARAGVGLLPVAVRSAAGGFAARFPSTPDPAVRDIAGRRLHVLAAPGDAGTSFTLVWSDHVVEAIRARDAVCRAELAGLVASGAAVLRDEAAALADLDGRMLEAVLPDGREVRGRVAMRGARVFALVVTGPAATVDRSAQAFFLAFALRGEGLPDPPTPARRTRVMLPGAGASLELEGTPEAEPGSGTHGVQALRAVSRGGLRLERAYYVPSPLVPVGRDELLLGGVAGMLVRAGAKVVERRDVTVLGRAARDVRLRLPHEDVYLRTIVLDDGALTLILSGIQGTLSRRDAADFFGTVRIEGGAAPGI